MRCVFVKHGLCAPFLFLCPVSVVFLVWPGVEALMLGGTILLGSWGRRLADYNLQATLFGVISGCNSLASLCWRLPFYRLFKLGLERTGALHELLPHGLRVQGVGHGGVVLVEQREGQPAVELRFHHHAPALDGAAK